MEVKPWKKRGNWNPVQSFLHNYGTQRLRKTFPSKSHPRYSCRVGKKENKGIFKMGPGEGESGAEKLGCVWARTSTRIWGKDPV